MGRCTHETCMTGRHYDVEELSEHGNKCKLSVKVSLTEVERESGVDAASGYVIAAACSGMHKEP